MIRVLSVDDEPFNLDLIRLALTEESDIDVIDATNGKEAIDILKSRDDIDVVLLDIRMPILNGLDALKIIREEMKLDLPVIVITANHEEKYNALSLGATDFLTKPLDTIELKLRVLNYASSKQDKDIIKQINKILEEKVRERTAQLQKAYDKVRASEEEVVRILGRVSEYRDLETGLHIQRIALYSEALAMLLREKGYISWDDDYLRVFSLASMLHDIGKIGIPDKILLKPGKLTDEEFEIIKKHTEIGYEMLKYAKFDTCRIGGVIAYTHHEKWNGTGYPRGLKGEEIPIEGRIVAILDVFDALASKRIYKPPFPMHKVIEILKESRATHFDPVVLDTFLENKEKFIDILEANKDDDVEPHIISIAEYKNEYSK